MITALASLLLAATAAATPVVRPSPVAASSSLRPKLILALTIDQFRYDYLTRFRSEYTGGLRRLLDRGAVFTRARYQHFPTVTAIGHSTYLSGGDERVGPRGEDRGRRGGGGLPAAHAREHRGRRAEDRDGIEGEGDRP